MHMKEETNMTSSNNTSSNSRPKQAVILAGGMGVRLKPLTDSVPKPMVKINQKPFLEYLITHLREQGFKKILLLLGYLPEVVQNYFGDGSSFGVEIQYSVSEVDNETGKRLKLAENFLEENFLLLYSDNYWPISFQKMWELFVSKDVLAQITVYSNKDNYSKNNVYVTTDGIVAKYDKSRSSAQLNGVEIGFAFVKKEVLSMLPDKNVNFEGYIFPILIEQKKLAAFVTDHRYYSVGSHERLKTTELFLQRQPAVILDRDGVLNKKAPKAEYIKSWSDFMWLPGAIESIGLLRATNHKIIIVTNQAGIARGMMTESDLFDIHEKMKLELLNNNASIDAIYYCPHGWDEGCICRKPKPGMLYQAQRDFHLDLTRTYFIGDDIRDQEAGDAAGCKTILTEPNSSLLQIVKEKIIQEAY